MSIGTERQPMSTGTECQLMSIRCMLNVLENIFTAAEHQPVMEVAV